MYNLLLGLLLAFSLFLHFVFSKCLVLCPGLPARIANRTRAAPGLASRFRPVICDVTLVAQSGGGLGDADMHLQRPRGRDLAAEGLQGCLNFRAVHL